MIKAAGIAGAAAWTAPVIVDSLSSPAAATSGGLPTSCSYALIVFTYNSNTYVMKIQSGSASCAGDDTTSNDTSFSTTCGSNTFSSTSGPGGGTGLLENGQPINTTLPAPCDSIFLIQGDVVSVRSAFSSSVVIIFGVSHTAHDFFPQCANGTSITFTC